MQDIPHFVYSYDSSQPVAVCRSFEEAQAYCSDYPDREFYISIHDYSDEEAIEFSEENEPWDGFNSDAEADADALADIGWGTDEDYGYYGGE